MSRENPWTKHRQSFWEAKTGNPRLPLWQRVYCLAYGVHRRNGHAPFKQGEIAFATRIVDPSTGEIREPSKQQINRAIRTAVEYGFLHADSCARCLVVPPWGIEGGMLGSPTEPCRSHSEATQRPGVATQRLRRSHSEATEIALTSGNVAPLYDSSNPPAPDSATDPERNTA